MTRLADIFARKVPLAVDATPLAQARQPERQQRMAEAVRALLAVQKSAEGKSPPDLASSPLVDVATTLWTRVLRFDAADPHGRTAIVWSSPSGRMVN